MATPALVLVSRRSGLHVTDRYPPGPGIPLRDSLLTPFGARFSSDDRRHRILVERGMERFAFGRLGTGPGEFRTPRGLAFLAGATTEASRLFVCDTGNDRVQVFDGDGAFVLAFGGRGDAAGQFDMPSGIALVWPALPGDDELPPAEREPFLAAADTGNDRVQIMTLDGVWVTTCRSGAPISGAHAECEAAWLRYTPRRMRAPSRVTWRTRYLDVTCAGARTLRIDLAAAMLPPSRRSEIGWPTAGRPSTAPLRLVGGSAR